MRQLCEAEVASVHGAMGGNAKRPPLSPQMRQCETGMFWGVLGGAIAGAPGGLLGIAAGAIGGFIGGGGSAGCFEMRPYNLR